MVARCLVGAEPHPSQEQRALSHGDISPALTNKTLSTFFLKVSELAILHSPGHVLQ